MKPAEASVAAWVRSPHCAFRTLNDEGKRTYGLCARTFSTDYLEFDSRVNVGMREENLAPRSPSLQKVLRVDAITMRAVHATSGMGFADFLEQIS